MHRSATSRQNYVSQPHLLAWDVVWSRVKVRLEKVSQSSVMVPVRVRDKNKARWFAPCGFQREGDPLAAVEEDGGVAGGGKEEP